MTADSRDSSRWLPHCLVRGRSHRRRLADIDTRIAVTGTRGKSTVTWWLHDVFVDRNYDTYAKITGDRPLSLYNGREYPIDRRGSVTLYENEREIRRFDPLDVLVVENQGIREYTMRLVNERYVRPHVVALTNIRQDHLDTLGADRWTIARAFARSIPTGTAVLSTESDALLNEYLAAELERRGASLTHVAVPAAYADVPGAENVFLVDAVLRARDELPLEEHRIAGYLAQRRVRWTALPGGRVYDASDANDVESTDCIRRALSPDGESIEPLVYLRHDRPGRTASYLEYLDSLAAKGCIEHAHVFGAHARTVARRASIPLTVHDETLEAPGDILDAALAHGRPVVLMANGVPDPMQEIVAEVERRSTERQDPAIRDESVTAVESGLQVK